MQNKSSYFLIAFFIIYISISNAKDISSFGGTSDSLKIRSTILNAEKDIYVYLPKDYNPQKKYPVIYCLIKAFYFNVVKFPQLLDSLYASGFPEAIIASVDTDEEEVYADTHQGKKFREFAAKEITAEIDQKYSTNKNSQSRFLLGFSAGATVACEIAFEYPGYFGKVAAQSPGWMTRNSTGLRTIDFTEATLLNLKENKSTAYPSFWFVWGDEKNIDVRGGLWESRSRENSTKILRAMKEKKIRVELSIVPGSHSLQLYHSTIIPALNYLMGK
jgi:enterochelin esterase-like enzyme